MKNLCFPDLTNDRHLTNDRLAGCHPVSHLRGGQVAFLWGLYHLCSFMQQQPILSLMSSTRCPWRISTLLHSRGFHWGQGLSTSHPCTAVSSWPPTSPPISQPIPHPAARCSTPCITGCRIPSEGIQVPGMIKSQTRLSSRTTTRTYTVK